MTIEEILCIIERMENKIIVGKRNDGKILLHSIISYAQLEVLNELKNKLLIFNKEKHK